MGKNKTTARIQNRKKELNWNELYGIFRSLYLLKYKVISSLFSSLKSESLNHGARANNRSLRKLIDYCTALLQNSRECKLPVEYDYSRFIAIALRCNGRAFINIHAMDCYVSPRWTTSRRVMYRNKSDVSQRKKIFPKNFWRNKYKEQS